MAASKKKADGIKGWLFLVIFCAMLCALEIRGYLSALAQQSVLEIPPSWRYVFVTYCVWICWEIVRSEYKKGGIVLALIKATFECGGIVETIYLTLVGIAGRNILESPPYWKIGLYVGATALLGWASFYQKKEKKSGLETNYRPSALMAGDRCALLLFAIFFLTKIGMAFVTGHQAIALKGIGCVSLGLGTILMLFNRLDALFPDEAEFPSNRVPSVNQYDTKEEKESTSLEFPLGLR
jgi:hypothetical protein